MAVRLWEPASLLPQLPLAACRGADTSLFYPERGESAEEAVRICRACPERRPCLHWALEHHETVGIWGGTSARQRLLMSRAGPAGACDDGQPVTGDDILGDLAEPTFAELAEIEHNSNGHAPGIGETKSFTVTHSPGETCSQCSKPAHPGRPTCGARDCVEGHRRAVKRARYAAGSTPGRTAVRAAANPGKRPADSPAVATGALTSGTNGVPQRPSAPALGSLVAALVPVARQHPGIPISARQDGIAVTIRSTNGAS